MNYKLAPGDYRKMGVTVQGDTAVFTFEVKTDAKVVLHLYDRKKKPLEKILLDESYRRGRLFSVSIKGFSWMDTAYLIERDGEVVVDPYATRICGREKWAERRRVKEHYKVYSGISSDRYRFKHKNPSIDASDMVMYKLHMRGFTMLRGLSDENAGNVSGLKRKLKECKDLGVTSLEFMPLYEFEELQYRMKTVEGTSRKPHLIPDEAYNTNYWGYGLAQYMAPKASYFGAAQPENQMKEMIDKIHGMGMEIIMEMSFVPELSADYILDVLHYWVTEYHVDGFHLLGYGLPMNRIADDALLGRTKIFHDHFDAETLEREKQYKHKHLFIYDQAFLYPLRKLQNHMEGSIIEFANMMKRQNSAYGFVNYAANNYGFTLRDVYSYSEKHNEMNGEENHDGDNYNFSHNYGQEGDTKSKAVQNIRLTHIRTALATVLTGQGIPLILAGDEAGNTQNGNNNAYCQDNELGWVEFSRQKRFRELRTFTKNMIAFRKEHKILSLPNPMEMSDYRHKGIPDLSYHGKEPWTMWLSDDMKSIGILYDGAYAGEESDVMLLFNFYFGEDSFALPKLNGRRKWYEVMNTTDGEFKSVLLKNQKEQIVPGGSVTILVGKKEH